MRPRRYVLQNTLSVVCSSNAFIFSQFRTLFHNGRLATPSASITSALFPVQRRGRGSPSSPNFQMRFVHPARCVGTFKSGFGIPHASSGRVRFKRALSPLECALSIPRRMRIVPAPFPTASEHRESKDLNSRVSPLECAFTKNRGWGSQALLTTEHPTRMRAEGFCLLQQGREG
jgi:hypothetical protein